MLNQSGRTEYEARTILASLVSLDLLTSLDGLIWLQSGKQVGIKFQQHQTTVSRNQKKCSQIFGLELKKHHGIWAIEGRNELLEMERKVHQFARFSGKAPLRIEVNSWNNGFLDSLNLGAWLTGACKPPGVNRCQYLLLANIVDAWLCPLDDTPSEIYGLKILPLCRVPLHLMVPTNHPLLSRSRITLDETKLYPWKQIPKGAYPKTEEQLRALGLWPTKHRNHKFEEALGDQNKLNFMVQLGTILLHEESSTNLVPLPIELGANTGVSLIFRQEYAKHKAIEDLITSLRKRLKNHQTHHPEIQLLD